MEPLFSGHYPLSLIIGGASYRMLMYIETNGLVSNMTVESVLYIRDILTLYQPMTLICVMSSHKPIKIYMGGLILGVNTLYRLSCFCKLFPMVGKGLTQYVL